MDKAFWLQPLEDLKTELQAEPTGLASQEAERRLSRFGPNVAAPDHVQGTARQIIGLIANPLVLILLAAALMSAIFGETTNALIITTIVIASLALDFVQTFRSQQAADALRRSVMTHATVLRDGKPQEIPVHEIVPGDVFLLSAGDLVPADGRLLESRELFVDQAALTGESLPAEKQAGTLLPEARGLDEATNAVFAGTSVTSGTARAIAVHTGARTAFGGIATELTKQPPPTEFEHGMADFAFMILRLTAGLVLFVFLTLALLKHEPLEAFLFSIALAVGLTPEFLPMIVTVTLARGAMRMSRRRVIVKQLQAIQNLGSLDVLCSDKTGTLTEGAIVLQRHVDPLGAERPEVLAAVVLNSLHETGIKSPLDEAILRAPHEPPEPCEKLDEIPFDFHRRRLSVVLMRRGERVLISKGAPEAILEASTRYRLDGEDHELDAESRTRIDQTFEALSKDGFRVLGVAERKVEAKDRYAVEDERELTLLGFAAFLDPPKQGAAETLEALRADGIRVVILTGDNEWVTRHVCRAVGLDGEEVILGHQLDGLQDHTLASLAERVSIFARMNPEQKDRVVRALKHRHVVGYLGDGINDAPSLRVADVGISVDSAADVAKEAAPIILLDKSLEVLHQGVLEGRRSFTNVIKYVMMGTSSNFGNMFSMAGAAAFLPFLPMLPTQVLLNNLLYDAAQLTLPGDRVDPDAVQRPHRWSIRFIQRFMFYTGPVSSIFDFLTFGILLWGFHAGPALFHTGWFVESLLTQTMVIFVIRTRKSPLASFPSAGLAMSVLATCLVSVGLPYMPFARDLGFVPLPPALLGAIALLTIVYLALTEGMKRLFYREWSRLGPR